jgi:hypothetical protein
MLPMAALAAGGGGIGRATVCGFFAQPATTSAVITATPTIRPSHIRVIVTAPVLGPMRAGSPVPDGYCDQWGVKLLPSRVTCRMSLPSRPR